jgi:anti-anti-sigma factor
VDVLSGPSGHVVTVHGRIDAQALSGLRDRLHQVIDTGSGDVVLLLGDAEIGDATALGLLVGAHHRARRAGRRLVVSEVSDRTARLLRASRLDRVLVGIST